MSFRKAISALFDKNETEKLEVEHGKFSSTRLMIVVAFAGLLLSTWVVKGLVTDANIQRLTWVVIVYIIGNSVTKSVQMVVNGWIKNTQARAFLKDGTLSDNERDVLLQTETKTKVVAAASQTP